MRVTPPHTLLLLVCLALAAGGCGHGDAPGAWQVTISGYGPIEPGMTLAQAQDAAGRRLTAINPGFETCDFVYFEDDPARRVGFMVIDGVVARIDISDSAVATGKGIRVGDPESRVMEQYAGRVTVSPHKYVEGHYLTVSPATTENSGNEMVFETDGERVTTYRIGRVPEVEFIEGCS